MLKWGIYPPYYLDNYFTFLPFSPLQILKTTWSHKLFYLITTFSIGCSFGNYDNTRSINESDFEKTELVGIDLILDSLFLPERIYFEDGLLYVIDKKSPHGQISIFDIKSRNYLGNFLRKGSGPNEVIVCSALQFDKLDNLVIVTDNQKKKMLFFQLDSLLADNLHAVKSITLNGSDLNGPLYINENLIVDSNLVGENRFIIYNSTGENIKEVGKHPVAEGFENLNNYNYSALCDITLTEDATRIISAYRFTDLMEIFDLKGNLLVRNFGPEQFFPSTTIRDVGNGGSLPSPTNETLSAYSYPRAGNGKIMIMFNGKNIYDGYHVDHILVFDLNGKPLMDMQLDISIFHFDVDWNNKIIYGLSHDPEPRIVAYKF